MKLLMIALLSATFSSQLLAAQGDTLELTVGEHVGKNAKGKTCSIVVTDKVGECSSCKYKIIYKEKGREVYNYFTVLAVDYAIHHSASDTGVYLTELPEMMFGGSYVDNLSLEIGENGKLVSAELVKEARLFGSDTVKTCELNDGIEFSIIPVSE